MVQGNVGSGVFSTSIEALQHQVNHLLAGLGGEEAITLLDLLGELGEFERTAAIKVFVQVTKDLLSGHERHLTKKDEEDKHVVDEITEDILRALRLCGSKVSADAVTRNVRAIGSKNRRNSRSSAPVDLAAFRANRRPHTHG